MSSNSGFNLNEVETVIVAVKYNGHFHWYKSDRDLWVLDLEKWHADFTHAGIKGHHESNAGERFGILVVNEETAEEFLRAMHQFEVNKDRLAKELAARFPDAESWWDVSDLFPIMLVDFDRKHVCAFYSEGTRMERYIPANWSSEFEDFLTKYPDQYLPTNEKYWVQNGLDLLRELNERGQQLEQQK